MQVLISFITGVAIVACLLAGSSATFFGKSVSISDIKV
jgi:hypothetical protein